MSSILSSILSSPATTFTNEVTGTACWTSAKVKSVEIETDSDNSDSPLSTEQISESSVFISLVTADVETSKIMKPVRVKVTMFVGDISTLQNIITLWRDVTVTLSITSKSVIANSLAIANVDIIEAPEMLSAATVMIDLEQVQPPQSSSYNPQQPGDQSSYGLQFVQPSTVGTTLGAITNAASLLGSSATDAATALFNQVSNNLGL